MIQSEGRAMQSCRCYCGGVEVQVDTTVETNAFSGFCHCKSCREAHSAPMYQVFYVPSAAVQVVRGEALLRKFGKTPDGLTRSFCSQCGSRMFNEIDLGPVGKRHGLFPSIFDHTAAIQARYPPRLHVHAAEAVMDLETLNDGLPRIPGWDTAAVNQILRGSEQK